MGIEQLIPKFIRYQLYLLQLENYELGRYWKLLKNRGFFPSKKKPQRKELIWSAKAKALMVMAVALHGLLVVITGLVVLTVKPGVDNFFSAVIIAAVVVLPFYFILFSVALLVLSPLDAVAKKKIVARATAKLTNLKSHITVIGIAGSYGKTTIKEVLKEVLGIRYKVLATPESVNTPVGIGRWVLNKVNGQTEVIIVEMGEHYLGDIQEVCEIVQPDVAVVTGINESHLERMKTLATVKATIFEIVAGSKPGATILLNGDDKNVMESYEKFMAKDNQVVKYKLESIKSKVFYPDKLVWQAELDGIGKVFVNLLGEYGLGDVAAAAQIAKVLGMSAEEIKNGIAKIKPVEHRLQPLPSNGLLVIDDSYNGNPDGVAEAIKVLSRFAGRRKVYITPGLVEMGLSSESIHREIGRQLAGVADVVILIKNSVTGFIEEGITSAGQLSAVSCQLIWFNTAQEAHSSLPKILKPGDVVLFQNDWGDQYV